MENTTDLLTLLLRELIETAQMQTPVKHTLWGIAEIAAAMRVSRDVAQQFTALPDFPSAYRFPSTGSGRRGHPRWRVTDVMAWWERYKC